MELLHRPRRSCALSTPIAAVTLAACLSATTGLTRDAVAACVVVLDEPTAYASQSGPSVPIATGHLFTLDIDTGAMTDLGLPDCGGAALGWDAERGRLLGFGVHGANDGIQIWSELTDLTTMPGKLIGTDHIAGYGNGLARDPTTGMWYVLTYGELDSYLYEVDIETGALRFIGYDWGVSGESLAINSRGEAFATQVFEHKVLYRVNLETGELTVVGPLNEGLGGGHPQGLCFDANDVLWMITGGTIGQSTRLYTIDIDTGQATQVRFVDISGWYKGLAILP